MRRLTRFLLVLLGGLALLTLGIYFALTSVTRDWFEKDLRSRSQLAVNAAQRSLAESWGSSSPRLRRVLTDLTQDERVLGTAACAQDGELLAATEHYPEAFSCEQLLAQRPGPKAPLWTRRAELAEGPVHLSVVPLTASRGPLGAVVLAHDLGYVASRDATTRYLLLGSYFVLSVLAAGLTLLAARHAWQDWTMELQRALTGAPRREFQPLVTDVRRLVERLAQERDHEVLAGAWTPERLRATLTGHLQGERIVILANREPYIHERTDDGIQVLHPASGLVTALEPVMRACSGVWVAHGSGSADKETVDARDRVAVPPGEESYQVRRVWLSEAEEDGYYYGFSNEGLWPLCHVAHARPVFRAEDWEQYVQVNRKFADAVCEEVDSDDPIVLIQDYHFALVPKMIRERLPRATLLTFWHVPWPGAERMSMCPWRDELLSGLLGSSILGFHTQLHCNNFIDSVDAFLESRIDREVNGVVHGGHQTLVRPHPISIEWPVRWLADAPSIADCRATLREELGLPADVLLGIGVDRLDYTKGIEERLQAVDQLLERYPEYRGRFSFVQVAAPSRAKLDRYRELNERVEQLTEEINARWSDGGYRPIVLFRSHHDARTIFRFYRAAELCYVSSLDDGMNLVAKEFVAARDDAQGVLVLSRFTGAARELTEALIVNPYDLRQASDALAAALKMPEVEQRERMQSLRRLLAEFNVYRWAGRMLVEAVELRRRERLNGRLSGGDAAQGEP